MQIDQAAGPVMWSSGKLASVEACPACGSLKRSTRPMLAVDPNVEVANDVWSVWRCGRCASLYLDPRPDDASLPQAYAAYYTHSQPSAVATNRSGLHRWVESLVNGYLNWRFGFARRPSRRLGAAIFSFVLPLRYKLDYYGAHLFERNFSNRGLLLDVGCGNGAFLARAREMGWTAIGVDPDPTAAAACRMQGLEAHVGTVFSMLDSLAGRCDVIISSHSLEHSGEPEAQLGAMFELLRPGGYLWLALPNPTSIGARFFRQAWRGLEAPRHLCIPSQRRLLELLQLAGFTEIRFMRRGIHAASITRESSLAARLSGDPGMRYRYLLTPLIRIAADVSATLSGRWGEETVLMAKRGVE